MYSRNFSDKPTHLPPHYGGTALHGGQGREEKCKQEGRQKPPSEERCKEECREEKKAVPPPPERGLLSHLLPFDIKGDDLLLLGIALLLLNEGCEDEYLPLILLFLLIVH